MHTHKTDRNKHLRLVQNIRRYKSKPSLTTLNTPAGTYHGTDILEGFAKDAELLGEFVGEAPQYDNQFYRLCIQDNKFIFDLKPKNYIKIPKVSITDLNNIIDKELKRGKACDIYKLTAEHLKNAGNDAKIAVLALINDIIENIEYLACPQIKVGIATAAYKGKRKPVSKSSSYRRITVTPQIGSLLDRFVDPIAERIFSKVQSVDQYGFTRNISYLLGAVLRGECQRYALDNRQTCFGVSFDGQAAFPSVDRSIQLRELYSCGESGDILKYSRNIYANTVSKMKQDGLLSREIHEYKGSRQGHKRSSGHFKIYINPCLLTADSTKLGFYIGPICISVICIADDTYILSGTPRGLQGLVNVVGHYGHRYRLIFGADKTKVTVTGSRHDMDYYRENNIWSLYGQSLEVAEDNDHLGLIVSGRNEEQKNVDKNINAARRSLFSFLGNIFAYKCKISPEVQLHTWSVFVKPVLRSGLSALPIRPTVMQPLIRFHHKILRAILKLSNNSPVVPLYFLLGELPMEATLHLDILSLFWNIWVNPQTKTFEVLKYLLMMSNDNSLTWAAHVRTIFLLYSLPNPLELLSTTPWPKKRWKDHANAVVISYHESALRSRAANNRKLQYLNVNCTGLAGKSHPILSWVHTTQDVVTVRPHIKMLAGDYLCYDILSKDRGVDPHCRLCSKPPSLAAAVEDYEHLLTGCSATRDTRTDRLTTLLNTVSYYNENNKILNSTSNELLTQFLLDCTSLNLPSDSRIPPNYPGFTDITRQCSLTISAILRDRTRHLKTLGLIG